MKVTKIVGLLLVACSLFGGLQAMDQSYVAEERLLKGNLSVDMYFSTLGKEGHAPMVNALRTADYRQSPDGSYYEELINAIEAMIVRMGQNEITWQSLRNLKFRIRRFIEFYYNELKNAKKLGTVKLRRAT